MTKYSTDFKIMAVRRYFDEYIAIKSLARELKLSDFSVLKSWINAVRQQEMEALVVKQHKSNYSLNFKIRVGSFKETGRLMYNVANMNDCVEDVRVIKEVRVSDEESCYFWKNSPCNWNWNLAHGRRSSN